MNEYVITITKKRELDSGMINYIRLLELHNNELVEVDPK